MPHADSANARFPARPVSGRAGASLKHTHLDAILAGRDQVGFFEVHAENYMGAGGPPHAALARIRRDYPVLLHGVCMSIGAPQPLDAAHLARFKALVERYEPAIVSEHLAWSTHDDVFYNDLLPLPYTDDTLQHVCEHIDQVQAAIGRRLLLENPSTYLVFAQSDYDETGFIREIVKRTGCGLLLDVNNVSDAVWKLFDIVVERAGTIPTLVEWDGDIPDWPVLKAEADAAQAVLDRHAASARDVHHAAAE